MILSRRAEAISTWLDGLQLEHVAVDLVRGQVSVRAADGDGTAASVENPGGSFSGSLYTLAETRTPVQAANAESFERGKTTAAGLHFIAVQSCADAEYPDGFWLLRQDGVAGEAEDQA